MKQFASFLFLAFFLTRSLLPAAAPANPPPDERLKADLLVVVAHPDDETELGAYLARAALDEKKRIAVVFGTRGNSGGNAEGQEQAGALSTVREWEARQALGFLGISKVWFLDAPDTPGQDVLDSLETWHHGESLGRLVRIVRLTRPAVIATWLPDWVAGENHGDHQASGVLATEAFDLAGDPTVFPEQLSTPRNREDIRNLTEGLHPWQPQKLYFVSDSSHKEFMKGKGPAYSAKDESPSHHETYGKLAAQECAFHLTQGDTGQFARAALAKNDWHDFEEPVTFLFGKSLVGGDPTADLFAAVKPAGIAYQRPPGFVPRPATAPYVELGGPWHFYREFWPAHGLGDPATLLPPEIMAKAASPFIIPVLAENPTDQAVTFQFSADLPEGWSVRRPLPSSLSVAPHQTAGLQFEIKTQGDETHGWKTIAIDTKANGQALAPIRVRAEVNASAMPQ